MAATAMTPDSCAWEVMETVPLVMRFIRAEMCQQGKPVLSVSQFRALVFLNLSPGVSLCIGCVASATVPPLKYPEMTKAGYGLSGGRAIGGEAGTAAFRHGLYNRGPMNHWVRAFLAQGVPRALKEGGQR